MRASIYVVLIVGICVAVSLVINRADSRHLSGGNVPPTCGPDAAPSQAAAVGYTCETFYDGNPWTLSTIDVNNTGAPGYKWYVSMNWPLAAQDNWDLGISSPGDLSIVSNNLLISPTAPVTFGPSSVHVGQITSCNPIVSSPYYQGTPITGGMYWEVLATWSGTATGEPTWPIAWSQPTQFLVAGVHASVSSAELDNFEAVGVNDRGFHWWTYSGGSGADHGAFCSGACTIASGTRFGYLLAPSSDTGGVGKIDYYQNNTFVETQAPPTGFTTSVFDSAAAENKCIIIGGSHSAPATFQTLRIWQKPR